MELTVFLECRDHVVLQACPGHQESQEHVGKKERRAIPEQPVYLESRHGN